MLTLTHACVQAIAIVQNQPRGLPHPPSALDMLAVAAFRNSAALRKGERHQQGSP